MQKCFPCSANYLHSCPPLSADSEVVRCLRPTATGSNGAQGFMGPEQAESSEMEAWARCAGSSLVSLPGIPECHCNKPARDCSTQKELAAQVVLTDDLPPQASFMVKGACARLRSS